MQSVASANPAALALHGDHTKRTKTASAPPKGTSDTAPSPREPSGHGSTRRGGPCPEAPPSRARAGGRTPVPGAASAPGGGFGKRKSGGGADGSRARRGSGSRPARRERCPKRCPESRVRGCRCSNGLGTPAEEQRCSRFQSWTPPSVGNPPPSSQGTPLSSQGSPSFQSGPPAPPVPAPAAAFRSAESPHDGAPCRRRPVLQPRGLVKASAEGGGSAHPCRAGAAATRADQSAVPAPAATSQ